MREVAGRSYDSEGYPINGSRGIYRGERGAEWARPRRTNNVRSSTYYRTYRNSPLPHNTKKHRRGWQARNPKYSRLVIVVGLILGSVLLVIGLVL